MKRGVLQTVQRNLGRLVRLPLSHPGQGRLLLANGLVGLALLASLGSVVLCILHCHLLLFAAPSVPPTSVLFHGQRITICHTTGDHSAPVPSPIDYQGVRAISDFAPAPASSLPLLLLCVALLPASSRRRLPLAEPAPEPPPPRMLA